MSRLEEIRERAEKAIVELVSLLPEQISYAEYVGANSCYGSGPYIWTDPEPYVMDEAAKLIKELLAEVARLTDERDAAVRDMRRDSHCLQCKKHRSVGGDCLGFSMCGQDRPSWQWRGPCTENRRTTE